MPSVFTFQDFNVFSLYIFNTSMSSIFTFSRLQCLQSLHFKTLMSSVFTFTRLQYLQSLPFCKTSMSLVFTYSRLQCLQSFTFQDFHFFSLLHSQDFNVSYFVVQDYNVFCLILLILQCFTSG